MPTIASGRTRTVTFSFSGNGFTDSNPQESADPYPANTTSFHGAETWDGSGSVSEFRYLNKSLDITAGAFEAFADYSIRTDVDGTVYRTDYVTASISMHYSADGITTGFSDFVTFDFASDEYVTTSADGNLVNSSQELISIMILMAQILLF
jgi:hypothetical protein